ncbi:uncharacterized protein LOC113231403 isoform X2 [Hyposmocoma kahamanoa]|uniref:uncharacterized protein LOC113231403 isoform X2 n=1 Tax=Hyposmocoma kahamanoa TaxID=1477025 RepID=UPI000E6D8238|nr:uncharacterized protein LOC113231403 isoform X2 [Hyposmocoma kahamanoa]
MIANASTRSLQSMYKNRISRRGRKLQIFDDQRVLVALPKDIPERTWAEVLQKEENELVCLDIREEMLENALRIGYEHYMEKQNIFFVVHCAAEAWLKLIDWHFYRHDPGEDPTAYPPCYIPNRVESWIPDEPPPYSPTDTWCRTYLNKPENCVVYDLPKTEACSADSLKLPVVEDIPEKYWFPAKLNLRTYYVGKDGTLHRETLMTDKDGNRLPPLIERVDDNGSWYPVCETPSIEAQSSPDLDLNTDSEVLQKVTDYSTEGLICKTSSMSIQKNTTPIDGSLHGAGDSTVGMERMKRRTSWGKGRSMSRLIRPCSGKSKHFLPPLDAESRISIISDCRLRNLRLDTQFELSDERIESPFGDGTKKK